jgi:uncharacterized protein YndB with AHSA1/START domain
LSSLISIKGRSVQLSHASPALVEKFMTKSGSLTVGPNGTEARMTRTFAHPAPYVWEMLTASARLAEWLAPGTIEPKVGGKARLDFQDSGIAIDSTVTEFEPLKTVAYSWSSPGEPLRPLRFRVQQMTDNSRPDGTRLEVTLCVPSGEDVARSAAGFEAHLEMLAAALEGVPIKFPFQLFKALRAEYQADLA